MAAIINMLWSCDDAFAYSRVIENFWQGNGLRYNSYERVQAFTSPLWTLLLIAFRGILGDAYLAAMAASVLLNLSWLIIAATALSITRLAALLLILASSSAFMDYTSSGLEWPLIYLLITCFTLGYCRWLKNQNSLLLAAISAGLLLVTRHDLIVLVLPMAFHIASTHRNSGRKNKKTIAGMLFIAPILLWSVFSVIYYGRPLPNTFYAKISSEIPHAQYIQQGWYYLKASIAHDPATILYIAIPALYFLFSSKNKMPHCGIAIAIAVAYIFWVGGDFMQGRFFSHIFMLSTLLIALTIKPEYEKTLLLSSLLPILLTLTPIQNNRLPTTPPLNPEIDCGKFEFGRGISNERCSYGKFTAIWRYIELGKEDFPFPMSYFPADTYENPYILSMTIGMIGYRHMAIPLIDNMGLVDAFVSSMPTDGIPSTTQCWWRIGHTYHYIPDKYPESAISGQPLMANNDLNNFLSALGMLTRSNELFTTARWLEIYRFATGYYDEIPKKSSPVLCTKNNTYNMVSPEDNNKAYMHIW